MDKRKQGDAVWSRKFDEFGLSEAFEFLGRDWSTDHGKRVSVKCKLCGAVFFTWGVADVFKGKQRHLLCIECGAASDGDGIWRRSPKAEAALRFYVEGHTVNETAEKFGVPKSQINNIVKIAGASNGRDWQEENTRRHEAYEKWFADYIAAGGSDYSRIYDYHKQRAVRYGVEYDPTVTRDELIARDGLRCRICGGMCDPNDSSYGNGFGALSPTIDHIIPMSRGGGHVWGNVRVVHSICNSKKGNRVVDK